MGQKERKSGVAHVCISQKLPWKQVLAALGSVADGESLPHDCQCPLCRGPLTVYPDTKRGSWCHCRSCHVAGDPVELACKVWQMELVQAVYKLRISGVQMLDGDIQPSVLDRYLAGVVRVDDSVQEFWSTASSYSFQHNSDVCRLHEQLGLNSSSDPKRWFAQLGPYIGAITHRVARTYLDDWGAMHAHDSDRLPRKYRDSSDPGYVVIPTEARPGLLNGFWFVGYNGHWPDAWSYFHVNWFLGAGSNQRRSEPGVAFLRTALYPHKTFNDTVFVVDSVDLCVAIQGQHFRDHGDVLPIIAPRVSSSGEVPSEIWGCFSYKNWVFWAPSFSRETISMAAAAGGRVVFSPFDPTRDLARHMIWLKGLRKASRPWPEVLSEHVLKITDSEIERLLIYFKADEYYSWSALTANMSPEAVRRLELHRERRYPYRVIEVGRSRVVEKPDGYYCGIAGELLSDVRIRILFAASEKYRSATATYYYGYFIYKGKKYSLRGRAADLRKNVEEIITDRLVALGVGVPRFALINRVRLIELAILLYPPRIIKIPKGKRRYANTRVLDDQGGKDRPKNKKMWWKKLEERHKQRKAQNDGQAVEEHGPPSQDQTGLADRADRTDPPVAAIGEGRTDRGQ